MLSNYLIIALRSIRRNKITTSINVLGLSAGITCCLLLLLYVRAELTYDTRSDYSERIYRIQTSDPGSDDWALTRNDFVPAFDDEIPEIESTLRVTQFMGAGFIGSDLLLSHDGRDFYEKDGLYQVDPAVFDYLGFRLLKGDINTALHEPYQIILSQEKAQRYFGEEDPIGKVVTLENEDAYTVAGIMERPHSHLDLNYIISFPPDSSYLQWGYNFVALAPDADIPQVEEKINALLAARRPADAYGGTERTYLYPIEDIHFSSGFEWGIGATGNIVYVRILAAIAVLILLIACINFMNLTTAQSLKRAREVGLRKVLGAARRQLIRQFMVEAFALTVLSGGVAFVLVGLLVEPLRAFTDIEISLTTPQLMAGLALLTFVVAGLSGAYPAFVLSAFEPVKTLKGSFSRSNHGRYFRKSLVVAQFAISIFMIAGTLMIGRQMDFMQNRDLGFTEEQVIAFPIRNQSMREDLDRVKDLLMDHPGIQSVTATTNVPGYGMITTPVVWAEGMAEDDWIQMYEILADEDFIETMELEIVAGRNFSRDHSTDEGQAFLLNESAVRMLGWDDPIGKRFNSSMQEGIVVGVVKDFHWKSLHQTVEPIAIENHTRHENWWMRILALRVNTANLPETLAFLENVWPEIDPDHPFQYYFMDQEFNQQYAVDEQLGTLFKVFSTLAILIACLGLFGLTWFATTERTKEIGIRKVLGASVPEVVFLLSKEFLVLVGVAFVLATPFTWYGIQVWLSDFAYQTTISPIVFVFAFFGTTLVATLAVGYHTIKAAHANPVATLRNE